MSGNRILIVEDDKPISQLVKYNLEKAGFSCLTAISGEEAIEILDKQAVDLIILDIMLPKIDGFETCKLIKEDKRLSSIPIVMLTAKGEEVDKVVGFELGADDYIVKPFSPRELTLRIKAILRRRRIKEEVKNIFTADRLTIDLSRHKVILDKKEVVLTQMEFKLLVKLIQRKGRVQSRDSLLEEVWDIAADVTTRTIDTHIKRLRQKLGKAGKLIETIRGVGYRFSEEG
ncbi:MAG: response regulator transcription factor [Candidatus Omnitrophica bacterium]|nr:response regulator transcription factor [Candidatus Omnitrophota bacterium]